MKWFLTICSAISLLAVAPMPWSASADSLPSPTLERGNTIGAEHPLINKPAAEFAEGMWFNSSHRTLADYKGKVVLVEFWTYGCINCRHTLPAMIGWNEKFRGKEFQVVGVHTPEYDAERDIDNVREHIKRHGITYPIVLDNEYKTWEAYLQEYWPALYLIDRKGIIRYVKIGEGNYEETEGMIQKLLNEP